MLICVFDLTFYFWFPAKLKFLVEDLSRSSSGISSQPNESSPIFNTQDIPMIPAHENLYETQKQRHAKMVNFTTMYGLFMRW